MIDPVVHTERQQRLVAGDDPFSTDKCGLFGPFNIHLDGLRRRSLLAALAKSEVTVVREFAAYPSKDELLEIARLD